MKKIGISIFTEPEAGGAYQYTRSVLQSASILTDKYKGKYNFCVYSIYPLWKDICDRMNLEFKELPESKGKKILYHIAYRLWSVGNTNSGLYKYHPMWEAYDSDGLDLMIVTSPSWYGKPQVAKCIMPIFDLMHRYIDFEEVSGGNVGVERDRRYTAICKDADGVLVDSKLGVMQLIDCYGEEVEGLINKTYSLPFVTPDYVTEDAKGEKVDVPDKYILYPAQFWKHKNHVRLLSAAGELKEQGIEVKFVFTGSGKNAEEDINQAILEYGLTEQVTNLNYVTNEQLVYLYRNARAMMFPSFAGPTNIPPLEAMTLGCPVAVSDNYAMPEQVGTAGLIFDPYSVDAIKDCMRRLWLDDELCDKLSKAGLKQSKAWVISDFADELGAIIEEVYTH